MITGSILFLTLQKQQSLRKEPLKKTKKTPIPVKGRGLCYRGTTLISFDYRNLHSLHSEITAFNRNIFQIKLDPPNVDSRGEFTQDPHKMLSVTAFIP